MGHTAHAVPTPAANGAPTITPGKAITAIDLSDERCIALMVEFQEKFPAVWAEDIGEV